MAVSFAPKKDGRDPISSTESVPNFQYAYFHPAEIYVRGVPMALGDYLYETGNAASTYKYSDHYVKADLNGDTRELCFENCRVQAEGNTPAVSSDWSLKMVFYGENTITAENAPAISMKDASLKILLGGSVEIKSTGGNGIDLGSGTYEQRGGDITIDAAGVGIFCNKFSMTGGKLLACGDGRAIHEQMGFSYNSLPIFATTSVGGTLGTYKYANHNSYKAISIGHTVPPALGIPGDMDGDGDKDTDDAVYLLLHVMFGETDYPIANPDKDLNNDSKVNTDDAVYLLLHVMFGATDYPI